MIKLKLSPAYAFTTSSFDFVIYSTAFVCTPYNFKTPFEK